MRDSFSLRINKIIADRAGHRCSNPVCRRATSKAHPNDPELSVNLGIAAHITAASPNGPRYDQRLTTDERKSASNGIWVCTRCSKEIDSAESAYSVDLLRRWKKDIEVATARDTVATPDEIAIIISEIEDVNARIMDFISEWQYNDPSYNFDFKDFEKSTREMISYSNQRRNSYTREIEPKLDKIRKKSKNILGDIETLNNHLWDYSSTNYISMREMANLLNELREYLLLR